MGLYLFLYISSVFNLLVGTTIGTMIYLRDKQSQINRTFAVFCFFIALWSLGYFFPVVQDSKELSMLSFRLLHVGALFIAVSHFHFVCAVLDIVKKMKKYLVFGYLFNLIILFFIPTKLFFEDMVPKHVFNYWAEIGPVYSVWLFVWLIYVCTSVILLFKAYRKTKGIEQQKIKYILIGDILTFGTGSLNFFLFYDISVTPYFTFGASGQILAFFYLIIRYRFVDIRLSSTNAIKKIFAFLLSLLSSYFVFSLYPFVDPLDYNNVFAVAVLTILFFYFYKILNTSFFYRFFKISNFEHFQNVINEFRNKHIFYNNLKEFQDDIEEVFHHQLKLSSAAIITLDGKNKLKYQELLKYFHNENSFLVTDELLLKQKTHNLQFPYLEELIGLGEICFPLYFMSDKKLIGFFVLGRKPYQNSYSKEELDLLEHTAHDISLLLAVNLYNSQLKKEVKSKTQALQKQNTEMEQLLRRQSDFIAVTAHEFRTPLSIALFQLDETQHSANSMEEVKDNLNIMEISMNNLKLLTQKLFDVQQYDLNKVSLKCSDVNIKEYLEAIYKEFRSIMSEKSIQFIFVSKVKAQTQVSIDSLQMRQVIHNILTNAYKFTPAEGKVSMELFEAKSYVQIVITDSGDGVPDDEKERIFEKFQTRKVSMAMGIGLGLYISKKIVNLHDAKIWVEDSKPHGAKFSIRLNKVS